MNVTEQIENSARNSAEKLAQIEDCPLEKNNVIPAQAGIQSKKAFLINPLDTGLRRYDGLMDNRKLIKLRLL